MAGLDIGGGFGDLGMGSDASRVAAAILFIQASTNTLDVASALNSSPWTAQSFGADPEKRAACMKYVNHSMFLSGFYCVSAGVLAKSWWPVIGFAIAGAYMYWLYTDALSKAQKSGSKGWDDPGRSSQNGSTGNSGGPRSGRVSQPWN